VKDYNNSPPEKHKTSQSMQKDLAMEERGKQCGRMHKFPSSFQFLQFPSNPPNFTGRREKEFVID
jgi:hypothetical protein